MTQHQKSVGPREARCAPNGHSNFSYLTFTLNLAFTKDFQKKSKKHLFFGIFLEFLKGF